MSLAYERHYMMLAGRIEFDVLDKDHLLILFVEHGTAKDSRSILACAMSKELKRLGHTLGCLDQSLTFRIFAEKPEDFPVMFSNRSRCLLIVSFFFQICHGSFEFYIANIENV